MIAPFTPFRYTFEVSPVFTVMEKTLLQKMLDLIGFTDGDAIFTPGLLNFLYVYREKLLIDNLSLSFSLALFLSLQKNTWILTIHFELHLGGSLANMYALNVARYKRFPDVKKTGVYGLPKLCVLTSEKVLNIY